MSAPTTDGVTPDDEIHVVAFWTGIEIGVVRVGDLASTLIRKVCDCTDEDAQRLQDALLAGPFGPHGDALKLAAELGAVDTSRDDRLGGRARSVDPRGRPAAADGGRAMSAPLSTYWTTIAITALPPGWVNVSENSSPDADGALLFAYPCPAVLLQERLADGERDTRAVAARFEAGELEPAADDDDHYTTMTAAGWEAAREEAEREVSTDRARIKTVLLDRIANAGTEGISHVKLFGAGYQNHRAIAVAQSLQHDGLVTATVRHNPELPTGRERVYWLKEAKGGAR